MGVTMNGCNNEWVLQWMGVTMNGCYNEWELQLLGATMNWCYNEWVLQLLGVTITVCYNEWVLQWMCVTMNGCYNEWVLQWMAVALVWHGRRNCGFSYPLSPSPHAHMFFAKIDTIYAIKMTAESSCRFTQPIVLNVNFMLSLVNMK